jgi:hypothetical protein
VAARRRRRGRPRRGGAANDAVAVWKQLPDDQRTPARGRLMQLWVRGEVGRLTNQRAAEAAKAGNPGPEGSVAKLEFANFNKELYDFCIDLLGMDGQIGYDYTFRRPSSSTRRARQPRPAVRVLAGPGELDRGRHVGDPEEHPRRADPRPARRAAGRQGPSLEPGAAN